MFRSLLAVSAVVVSLSALALADLVDDSILTGDLGLGSKLDGGLLSGFDFDDDDHRLPLRPFRTSRLFGRGSVHVDSVPDLINLALGLSGHVVGRAGWIVHDAVRSLAEGVLTSRYRLTDDDGFYAKYNAGFANPKIYGGLDGPDLDDLIKF